MLKKDHKITFAFLDVGGGDAIWIRFIGDDVNWHNILVDGGYGRSYKNSFGPLIAEIVSKGEYVDLWIVTHVDLDHIGALMGFVQDKKIKYKKAAVNEFWFNHTAFPLPDSSSKLGVGQGIKLRDYLIETNQLTSEIITIDTPVKNFHGLTLTILSPTREKQNIANKNWEAVEIQGKIGRSPDHSDHHQKIETLSSKIFVEDSDPTNGSSIALLIQYKSISGLLLADSHPSDISTSLKNLGYSLPNPLPIDFIQVAHHGSKGNTNKELLEIIDTNRYIITGNGITNRHPDKEALVRILTNSNRRPEPLIFIFTSNTKEIRSIFEVDEDPYNSFNFSCVYPDSVAKRPTLNFLPVDANDNE